ncbi:unnamed protein product [Hymenolepis diminuta]|uniref:Uncharacterized protein n=1 Tax=Hymenolepis diminuta TaxID=6216 RepID=A0A564YNR1_HYMDI|nr:unnamed protein product [Hymenolepis diminuta]
MIWMLNSNRRSISHFLELQPQLKSVRKGGFACLDALYYRHFANPCEMRRHRSADNKDTNKLPCPVKLAMRPLFLFLPLSDGYFHRIIPNSSTKRRENFSMNITFRTK